MLRALGRLAVERPKVLLLSVLAPCLLLTASIPFIPLDLGFTGTFNMDDPKVSELVQLDREMNFGGVLTLLLEGSDAAALEQAAREVEEVLEARADVTRVVSGPPEDWLSARAPWLVDREDFDTRLEVAITPGSVSRAATLTTRLGQRPADVVAQDIDGHRMLLVQMAANPLELELGANDFLHIDAATQEVLAPLGIKGSYAGVGAAGAQDQTHVLETIGNLTPLSLLAVLLILRLVERRITRLALVGFTMVVALGATAGAVGLLSGKLTAVSLFFGIMVFGLGIDFALHIIQRVKEELSGGSPLAEALPEALATTGVGVIAGAVTTAGAFAMMMLSPEPAANHLGLSGAIGLLVCVLLMVTMLPVGLMLLDKGDAEPPPTAFRLGLVGRLASLAVTHPRTVLCLALVGMAVALAGTPRFHWESDLEKVFARDVPAPEVARRVQGLFGVGDPWFVAVNTVEEAGSVMAAFEASERFVQADSIASVIRPDVDERVALLTEHETELRAAVEEWRKQRDSRPLPMRMMLSPGAELAQRMLTALETGPPTLDSLPPDLRSRWATPGGRYLVRASTREPTMDGDVAREVRLDAEAVHPRATSFVVFYELTMSGERPWLLKVGLGILVLVLVVLMVDLRRPVHVFLALLPVVFGASMTWGILCWSGVSFNILTALTVPLLVGLGVDDGIHVLHRMREDSGAPAEQSASAVGQAIVLTTLTTCASFGILLFANHAGLESMALVVLIGLPICLLASVMLVPAAATILKRWA